jgi:hypothetical protein
VASPAEVEAEAAGAAEARGSRSMRAALRRRRARFLVGDDRAAARTTEKVGFIEL